MTISPDDGSDDVVYEKLSKRQGLAMIKVPMEPTQVRLLNAPFRKVTT